MDRVYAHNQLCRIEYLKRKMEILDAEWKRLSNQSIQNRRSQPIEDETYRIQDESLSMRRAWQRLDNEIWTYLRSHLAPSCLALCELMQQKLPRELRDSIYEYVLGYHTSRLDRERDYKIVEGMRRKAWETSDLSYGWMRDLAKHDLTHVSDVSFVGQETREELAEAYYRTTTFSFDDRLSNESIAALLFGKDIWGHNLNVANLIRTVELHVVDHGRTEYPRNVNDSLEVLLRLKRPIKIWVCLDRHYFIYNGRPNYRPMCEATIMPMLKQLEKVGHTVQIQYSSKESWGKLRIDENLTVAGLEATLRERKSHAARGQITATTV